MTICANCERSLDQAREIGSSGLYFPNGFNIDLCIDCFWAEEALTDEGTNDHPERLAHYLRTIGKFRDADRVIDEARRDGRLAPLASPPALLTFQLPVSDCGTYVAGEIGPDTFASFETPPPKYGVIVWYASKEAARAAAVATAQAHCTEDASSPTEET